MPAGKGGPGEASKRLSSLMEGLLIVFIPSRGSGQLVAQSHQRNQSATTGRGPAHAHIRCRYCSQNLTNSCFVLLDNENVLWRLLSRNSTKELTKRGRGMESQVASKLHTFLGSTSTFGHLLKSFNSLRCFVVSCLVTKDCHPLRQPTTTSVCSSHLQATSRAGFVSQ